jgi:N-methylhydantoinase B
LWDDSGGAGTYRGGMGVVRDYRILADDVTVSLSSERQHVPAEGLAGGRAGRAGQFVFNPGAADERRLPSAAGEVALPRDSVLRIATPGGGGCGDPAGRDPEARRLDEREERVAKH